ncbi:stage II sporulation protein M [Natrononativus amylolyticus]|uniref:stage II sporulation protein M n=1 Tax=Natrononativus amylolyticus TaxID=2963434 RepID=UPI0020CC8E55|nr:stage II sporulation protein M [Natrononativus amylolyticus]
MRLSDATNAVHRVLRRPSDLLPFYILGAAAGAVVRVIPIAALLVVYLALEISGRLDAFRAELAEIDRPAPGLESEEELATWLTEELVPALEALFSPEIGGVLLLLFAATMLAMFAAGVVLTALLSAGQLAACAARVRGARGLTAGVAGVRRYWPTFLALYLLEVVLWLVVTLGLLVVAALGAAVFGLATGLPEIGVLLALAAVPVWLLAVIAIRAVFALAPVAVVVDDVGAFPSLKRAAAFIRHNPVLAAFYYVISVGALLAFGTLISILSLFGAGTALSLASTIVLLPVLDLLKTALYTGARGRLAPPPLPEAGLWGQFRAGTRRGWDEMVRFVRATPGIHALSIGTLAVGLAMGWVGAAPFAGIVETSIAGRLEGHLPPRAALEFFGNNWTVALTTAYSGVAFAVPALVSLWFNGVAIGAIARLEVELLELIAFVVPHGIFEIPAIIVAGAVGIHLGVRWWGALRGRLDRPAFADSLERAFWVLIGVGILLAVAAFIEGFISPYYWRPFL